MNKSLVLFSVFIAAITASTTSNSGCILNINSDLANPQPLYVNPGTSQFVSTEQQNAVIALAQRQKIELLCPSGFRNLRGVTGKSLIATCASGKQFSIPTQESTIQLKDIACVSDVEATGTDTHTRCNGGTIIQIGFQIDQRWISLMDVCHDTALATTHWVHHKLNPENNRYQEGVTTPKNFLTGQFFRSDLNGLYKLKPEQATFKRILGTDALATHHIPAGGNFLSRGHLAAKTDFILATHQLATCTFLNCAPQWKQFNSGNWQTLEEDLKRFIDGRRIKTDVYTGTQGILQYNNNRDVMTNIVLAPPKVPVPKVFYKVVVSKTSNGSPDKGIVFVGVNDPRATAQQLQDTNVYKLCDDDVSDHVNYIHWVDKHSLSLGYMYACTIDSFKKYARNLPTLPSNLKLLV